MSKPKPSPAVKGPFPKATKKKNPELCWDWNIPLGGNNRMAAKANSRARRNISPWNSDRPSGMTHEEDVLYNTRRMEELMKRYFKELEFNASPLGRFLIMVKTIWAAAKIAARQYRNP